MTDNAEQTPERIFHIQRVYVKDISFETPNSPLVFTQEWKPEINVGLNSTVTDLGNDHVEVVIEVSVTAKQNDKTNFHVEVQQAGIFAVKGFAEQEREQLLGIAAPNALFPYAREAVSDLVSRGSFPQFVLAPISFEAIYAQKLQQQQPSH